MMKQLRSLFAGALLAGCTAHAAQEVNILVTVTNTAGTVNGSSLTAIGSTRTGTNNISSSPSTLFLATNSMLRAKTNLYNHVRTYPFGSGATLLTLQDVGTNSFMLIGQIDQALTVSVGGTWGTAVLRTNPVVDAEGLRLPLEVYSNTERTNYADHLVGGINRYPRTNQFDQTAPAMAQLVGTTNSQNVANKTNTNSRFVGGSVEGTLATNMVIHATNGLIKNVPIQSSTISATSRLASVYMDVGGDQMFLRGVGVTNILYVEENGAMYLVQINFNPYTNSTPGNGEIVNYGTMVTLFPLRQNGRTNWWGSDQHFTNAWERIRFFFGFNATNASLFRPTNINQIVQGTTAFQHTNYITGDNIAPGSIFYIGDSKIGGPAGGSIGNFVSGLGNTLWVDDFPPAGIIGQGNMVTNDGKFAMGWGITVTNPLSYGFFGSPTEAGEFRIGEGQDFVRFGPKIKNLRTLAGATNHIEGDLSFGVTSITSLANGTNVIASTTNVILSLDGSPTADSYINGIQGGRDGLWKVLVNRTAFNIALLHESPFTPADADRFRIARSRFASIAPNGVALVSYQNSRWSVWSVYPQESIFVSTVSLTVDNQIVSTTNATYLRFQSNDATAANRTVILTAGQYQGQELLIEALSSSNAWELTDDNTNYISGNIRLNGTFTASPPNDLIRLIWNGTDWLEATRVNN